ncbi:MAG: hypothetical protein HZY73_14700 [Micropruina sp.]|nr:MAG: hypothetical protein HZY73_14700 [Micropruina sp.]
MGAGPAGRGARARGGRSGERREGAPAGSAAAARSPGRCDHPEPGRVGGPGRSSGHPRRVGRGGRRAPCPRGRPGLGAPGAAGSWLCRPGEPPQHVPAVPSVVADVTGAGDALTAAFVHARLRGDEPRAAARFAAAAAALTVAVPQTVRPDLTSAAVERLLAQNGEPR